MKKLSKLMVFVISVFAFVTGVNATEKNEVTLKFSGANEYDGYVQYDNVGKIQLFKGEELVTNIHDGIVIDLNEAEYKLKITEIEDKTSTGASGAVIKNYPVKISINGWYYPVDEENFVLNSSEFSGVLKIKLSRINLVVNTKVRNNYTDLTSTGVIDLRYGKEYIIDYTKTDDLTEGLKTFADLEKTLYYKRSNNGLLLTDNENEAVIKIVGNKTKNNAILTAINVGNKKSDVFKGFHMQYTGAALDYNSTSDGIIYETRFDYYTRCTYEFTFKYVEDIPEVKEYQVIEGANQKYTIDKDSDMTFRIDADYSLFDKKVYIDNELVDVNNYTSKEGSTIIVFNKDYVSTLNVGKHTLKVVFSDNNEALTNFEIIKEEKNEIIKNPETIDNIEKYIAIGIVAVIGIIGSTLLIRKSKEK